MENKESILEQAVRLANATPESKAQWDSVSRMFRKMEEDFVKKIDNEAWNRILYDSRTV